MPSDGADPTITGRCYCGAVSLRSDAAPLSVAYCHCSDCRRWTGAPVAAFAAFRAGDVTLSPATIQGVSHNQGVTRWNCPDCGSPLMAAFDYLPDQTHIPIGLLDQAATLPPGLHCHTDSRFPWLEIDDDLPRSSGSGRDVLNAS